MSNLIKPLILGLIVTKIAYLIPGLNVIAGVFGGFVAAYVYNGGPLGGIKVGLLKGLIFFVPAIILAGVLADFLNEIPVIGDILGASVIALALGLTAYTTVKAVIGGFIGGLAAKMLRSKQGEIADSAAKKAAGAANSADGVKETYDEHRDTNTTRAERTQKKPEPAGEYTEPQPNDPSEPQPQQYSQSVRQAPQPEPQPHETQSPQPESSRESPQRHPEPSHEAQTPPSESADYQETTRPESHARRTDNKMHEQSVKGNQPAKKEQKPPADATCSNCGKQIGTTVSFCPSCGAEHAY